ncbi:MAG: radical SAM protein [Deltaproteobacteria bacterium]|nr:radical SAM protein [Deltaproteobacteria bacterium]
MNVLLVQPAATDRGFIHLGLGFIAASLEERGHKVGIVDLGLEGESRKDIARLVRKAAPDAVGITALTPTYPGALSVADIVKELFPKCPVVFGGTHSSVLTDEVLGNSTVDFVIRGEGETAMPDLLETLVSGGEIGDVAGVSYRRDGKVRHNAPRPLIQDLDTLPPIPWHLFDMDRYTGILHGKRAVGISAARGCPYNCVFCYRGPAAGKTIRVWSPERVVREIRRAREMIGVNSFHFWNDVFTYDKRWVESFCGLLSVENIKIEWDCQTRADLINEDVLGRMKDAGCTAVMLGVESGSNEVLENMEKGLTKDKIREGFRLLHKVGFETTATFTLGLPWDTRETIPETIEFAKEINPNFAMFYVAVPFPGSPLWSICREKGISLSQDWANYRILPFEFDIRNMVPVFDTAKLSVEELGRFLKTAQIEFQLGRLKKGQVLRGLKNIKDIFSLLFMRSRSIRKLAGMFWRVFVDLFLFLKQKLFPGIRKAS